MPVTLAEQWDAWILQKPRCPEMVRKRPSSRYLAFRSFIELAGRCQEPWDEQTQRNFDQHCVECSGEFFCLPITMKKMVARSLARKVAAGMDIESRLRSLNHAPIAECLPWEFVTTLPSKKLLSAFRLKMADLYGTKLIGAGSEWCWETHVDSIDYVTTLTLGGINCQFSYERRLRFLDSSFSLTSCSWEEGLGILRPEWDQVTLESLESDLETFFAFDAEFNEHVAIFLRETHGA